MSDLDKIFGANNNVNNNEVNSSLLISRDRNSNFWYLSW
jgi:hypothetical protein